MLQNINILAGKLPPETGNPKEDYKALRAYVTRLVRGLELCLETMDDQMDKLKETVEGLKT